ncbi:DEAD/DEAH box helicase [Kitasatospora sp. NPDC052868]|uniref:DEAD/DEAH box helicase n=1 Tax=Kitasatospora sp. NPDC052868 TaxID=3364060 RepID=UPI0037CBBF6A
MPLPELRNCQREAFDQYMADRKRTWLAMLTPGAGKTIFALAVASRLKEMGVVDKISVFVPSDNLRQQWAAAAADFGLDLIPVKESADYEDWEFDGFVATYSQMAAGDGAEWARKAITANRTIVIHDEVHHLGDKKAWGAGTFSATDGAERILMLTGTPWRSDDARIPWCTYDPITGEVEVDVAYEYGYAVADGVCRAAEFHSYDAELRYRDVMTEVTVSLRDKGKGPKLGKMFDVVFDPDQPWTPGLLARAHELLMERRRDVPDAGGLVVTDRHETAEAIGRILERISGQKPTLVTSERDDPVELLDAFRQDGSRMWLVAIRMVSEGVDVPRLMVGCYLSRWKTPLYFRQFVGRFVRVRKGCGTEFDAHVIIPAVSVFMENAADIEQQLRDFSMAVDLEDDELDGHGFHGGAPGGETAAVEGAMLPAQAGPVEPCPDTAARGPLHDGAALIGDQGTLPFEQTVEVGSAEFYQSDRRGVGVSSAVYLPGEQLCRDGGVPTTWTRQILSVLESKGVLAQALGVTVPAAPPEPPKFRKKQMLRDEVKRRVYRLAQMQARAAGQDTAEYRGKRQKAINSELAERFDYRAQCSIPTLKKIVQFLTSAIEQEAAADRRRTRHVR